jgi:hypothetical protein
MILSSADILRVLGGSEIIRLSAKLKIVDGKPTLSGAEGLFIYIDRFPRTDEFQATWSIYIESDGSEPDDLVLAEIKKLLPGVKVRAGLMTTVTTTDFLSENTQRPPEAPKQVQAQVGLTQYEERFQKLVEDVQDQMLLVTSGRPGRDGRDGASGKDGRDGQDIQATETDLEDLANVEQGIAKEDGQVLTWKDNKWQNLFVPQIVSSISGGNGGGGATINQLNDIGDVDVPAPSHGDVLSYDSNSGNWISAAALPADISGNSIDDLSDVDTSTSAPSLNQALIWDGSNWVPGDVASSGLQPGDNVSELVNDVGYLTLSTLPADRVQSVNGQIGIVVIDADDIPTTGTVNKFTTTEEINKLAGIETGAQVNEVEEAPQDGNYYVRQNGQWVNIKIALSFLGVDIDEPIDGGNFTTGASATNNNDVLDGGNFTTGDSSSITEGILDGGNWSTGDSGTTYGT